VLISITEAASRKLLLSAARVSGFRYIDCEKSTRAVIPSEARDPSWFKCQQKERFLVASLLGMTKFLTFFRNLLQSARRLANLQIERDAGLRRVVRARQAFDGGFD
jgi:hypothetical protein